MKRNFPFLRIVLIKENETIIFYLLSLIIQRIQIFHYEANSIPHSNSTLIIKFPANNEKKIANHQELKTPANSQENLNKTMKQNREKSTQSLVVGHVKYLDKKEPEVSRMRKT